MSKLHIGQTDGKSFALPVELVTQTVAVLAKKGAGKSYTASVMAEEMLDAGHQVVVLDPTGAWYGLRASADGKGAGISIVVIGGDHGDLPLEQTAGETLARAIVERRFSAVIDLSLFRKGEMRRFVTAFLETLYRLNREAMHLFVDEADDIAPQRPQGDEAQMLGAIEDVVKRGRKKGIGCTLITQRPADLAKQVLTQCELLVALRIVHPLDIKAVMEWINVHADAAQAGAMVASLPSLPIGTAWFWSPGWGDIFARVEVRRRRTFDSGRTPKPGEVAVKPRNLAPVDVAKLGAEITKAAEDAKANDPKALKARIAQLEREAAKPAPAVAPDPKGIERAVTAAVTERDTFWRGVIRNVRGELSGLVPQLTGVAEKITSAWCHTENGHATPPAVKVLRPATVSNLPKPAAPVKLSAPRSTPAESNGQLGAGERKVLTVLAQRVGTPQRVPQIAVWTGQAPRTVQNNLSTLRGKGFVDGIGETGIRITDEGANALGDFDPLPTGKALRDFHLASIPSGEAALLRVVIEKDPHPVHLAQLSEATGQAERTVQNNLSQLRARQLVHGGGRTGMTAAPELFEENA